MARIPNYYSGFGFNVAHERAWSGLGDSASTVKRPHLNCYHTVRYRTFCASAIRRLSLLITINPSDGLIQCACPPGSVHTKTPNNFNRDSVDSARPHSHRVPPPYYLLLLTPSTAQPYRLSPRPVQQLQESPTAARA